MRSPKKPSIMDADLPSLLGLGVFVAFAAAMWGWS